MRLLPCNHQIGIRTARGVLEDDHCRGGYNMACPLCSEADTHSSGFTAPTAKPALQSSRSQSSTYPRVRRAGKETQRYSSNALPSPRRAAPRRNPGSIPAPQFLDSHRIPLQINHTLGSSLSSDFAIELSKSDAFTSTRPRTSHCIIRVYFYSQRTPSAGTFPGRGWGQGICR
jgi:hypothetical protein